MNLKQNQRLQWLIVALLGLAITVGLVLYALKQNINLFFTPTQVMAGEVPADRQFRLGGMVVPGSIKHDQQLGVEFLVTDYQQQVLVHYSGILPDLFRAGQGVVAEGKWRNDAFIASRVLAKHDENYMPPEVAAAIGKQPN